MNSNEKQHLHKEDFLRIQRLRLMDDAFMSIVFDGNTQATELLLNIIFGRNDITVTEVIGQREIKNANGRSVRLDIHAVDSTKKNYDIEIQRADKGAIPQRARYNSSMLDTKLLRSGERFSQLVDSYVIFITENDVLGQSLPVYHIDRVIEETGEFFNDGSHIIYVNGSYENDKEPIGKLMHDFRCTDADDMNYKLLADRVRYFKGNEGGRNTMGGVLEELEEEADYRATMRERKSIAVALWEDGIHDLRKIARLTKLTSEEVEEAIDIRVV